MYETEFSELKKLYEVGFLPHILNSREDEKYIVTYPKNKISYSKKDINTIIARRERTRYVHYPSLFDRRLKSKKKWFNYNRSSQRKDYKMKNKDLLTQKISKHFSLHPSRQKTLASMIFSALCSNNVHHQSLARYVDSPNPKAGLRKVERFFKRSSVH